MEQNWKDLAVELENKPGSLAKATQAIAKSGINLEGLFAKGNEASGVVHFLTQDAPAMRRALEDAGYKIKRERDVAVVVAQDKPGAAADIFRKIADQEINVDLVYVATNTRIVIGGDNVPKIREAVSEHAIAGRS